jgi:predicted nucleotidyltransferase
MEQGRLIFKCRIGSHLYGLNRPESDEDFLGVFIPKSEYLLGLKKIEEIDNSTKSSAAEHRNTADDIDDKNYTLSKYLHLALQNNPNIVEVLFATPENVLTMTTTWSQLAANRDKILSQRVFYTFTGYAFSQRKKLTVKSDRYTSLVEGVKLLEGAFSKEILSDARVTISEEESDFLNKSLKYYKGEKQNCESFHKGMSLKMIYEKLVSERDNYGWRVHTDTFESLGFDTKFGYHLIRILAEGHQLLSTGQLVYPISGEARNDILKVREGLIKLDDLLKMYDRYDTMCREAFEKTVLPKKPDFNFFDKWLIATLKKAILNEDLTKYHDIEDFYKEEL